MTNAKNKKKSSSVKKLIPAVGMLMISATMLATSTYAWFTMNKTVSVTNMQVQATAEEGLLISETSGHTTSDIWDDIATANSLPTSVTLLPTSTTNSKAWYHANSKSANDEAGASANEKSKNLSGNYSTLTDTLSEQKTEAKSGVSAANSIFYRDNGGDSSYTSGADSAYYVKYTYYVKASNESGISSMGLTSGAQNLSIKNVKVSNSEGATSSSTLDKSLRVGIVVDSKCYIFAPMYGETDTVKDYYVFDGSNGTTNIEVTPLKSSDTAYTNISSIPGVSTDDPIQIDVYVWYEGEDENCKSENVTATLDTLKVGFELELSTLTEAKSAPSNNAFSVS